MRDSIFPPIRVEAVARKLEQIRNFEQPKILEEMHAHPRLAEVLWFLAFVSRNENYPGGLRKFSSDLIAQSIDLLGTKTMQAHGAPPYPATLHETIIAEIPCVERWSVPAVRMNGLSLSDRFYDPSEDESETWDSEDSRAEELASKRNYKVDLEADRAKLEAAQEIAEASALRDMMAGGLIDYCKEAAEGSLAPYLVALCERPETQFFRTREYGSGSGAPWYFVRVAEAILRFIDGRKVDIAATIAETTVSLEIFKWLGKARSTNRSIVISGNSRFGKTEAVRAWAAMNAGLARIVETPASGGEGELLRAICKALGVEIGARQRGHELRGQVEFVLQQFRPVLIFEEASFLYPVNFSKNTMPARLNWVRRSVMDAGIPCAFVWTPQTHRDARSRFLKATNFAIEQFDGRILCTVNLPVKIPRADLQAIARIHFPGVPANDYEVVVCMAAATERNYCSDVSNIAALAYSNAEDGGRAVPNLSDIESAIADVLQSAPEAAASPRSKRRESIMHPPGTAREICPPGASSRVPGGAVEHLQFSTRSEHQAAIKQTA